jgi:hypothetical protein
MGNTNTAFTWKGTTFIKPTSQSCVDSCIHNAEEAARREAAALDWFRKTGSAQAKYEATKAYHEQVHWRASANHFRQLVLEEAHATLATEARRADIARRLEDQQRALNLSLTSQPPVEVVEHPGADDDGDARENPWTDIGGR